MKVKTILFGLLAVSIIIILIYAFGFWKFLSLMPLCKDVIRFLKTKKGG